MSLRNIEIKLVSTAPNKETANTAAAVIKRIKEKLNNPLSFNTIKISSKLDLQNLQLLITSKWFDCTARLGVTGGCYGARDGSYFGGLTLWMHPKYVVDRYVDSEYGEQVNPWHLLKEHGKHLPDVDCEAFMDAVYKTGAEIKSDNTYNYSGQSDYMFLFDFQFDHFEAGGKHFLAVMFHCGGDPRGNYTDKELWEFDSEDDLYSVLFPYKVLTEEEV